MRHRVSAWKALLAGALLLFINAGGMLGHLPCPQHDGAGHSHGAAARMSHGVHHGMASDAAPAPKGDHQGPHGPCTCLDHCCACQALGVPAVAMGLPQTPFSHSLHVAAPVSVRFVASRAPHQLPFANAPPIIA